MQTRNVDGLDQGGGSESDKEQSESEYIFRSSQQDLFIQYERKRDIKDDSKIFILRNWKNGVTMY